MTWGDLNDVLFDGSEQEIRECHCPDCGGEINFRYDEMMKGFEVSCARCGAIERHDGVHYMPNCAKITTVEAEKAYIQSLRQEGKI